jgi:hypothetical protein
MIAAYYKTAIVIYFYFFLCCCYIYITPHVKTADESFCCENVTVFGESNQHFTQTTIKLIAFKQNRINFLQQKKSGSIKKCKKCNQGRKSEETLIYRKEPTEKTNLKS